MQQDTAVEQAQAMIKAVHDDKCAEINGRESHITNINHNKRRKVFACFTHVQSDLQNGDFGFLDSPDWKDVEKTIEGIVTFDGVTLDKRPGHWEQYPQDYLMFVQTMLGALSYPFLSGNLGG